MSRDNLFKLPRLRNNVERPWRLFSDGQRICTKIRTFVCGKWIQNTKKRLLERIHLIRTKICTFVRGKWIPNTKIRLLERIHWIRTKIRTFVRGKWIQNTEIRLLERIQNPEAEFENTAQNKSSGDDRDKSAYCGRRKPTANKIQNPDASTVRSVNVSYWRCIYWYMST